MTVTLILSPFFLLIGPEMECMAQNLVFHCFRLNMGEWKAEYINASEVTAALWNGGLIAG